MTRWRCHLSIWACSSSRCASNSWFLGVRSATTLSTPDQKVSGSISVPGSASLLTKSYNVWATRRFPTVTRSVMSFLPRPHGAAWRTAVDPVYPRVAGLIPRGGAGSHQQFAAPIGDRGPQRNRPRRAVLLRADVVGPPRRGLDRYRIESVVAEIIGAGPHIEFTGVGGQRQAVEQ